ncbi:MAG TPA: hypothetical protein VE760_05730 [Acidimicrobiales bacterium]|nr:hypothetical protein [Acidimicrobiales bacterium]
MALVVAAVGGPRAYRRRPAPMVYDDEPVVVEEYERPVRRRRFF